MRPWSNRGVRMPAPRSNSFTVSTVLRVRGSHRDTAMLGPAEQFRFSWRTRISTRDGDAHASADVPQPQAGFHREVVVPSVQEPGAEAVASTRRVDHLDWLRRRVVFASLH